MIGKNDWDVLGIEPTADVKKIRKAYADASKKIHPEDNSEEFLRLKQVYEAALAFVKALKECKEEEEAKEQKKQKKEEKNLPLFIEAVEKIATSKKKKEDMILPVSRKLASLYDDFPKARDYTKVPAYLEFVRLYYGEFGKSEQQWRKYFCSASFLEVFLEENYLEEICRVVILEPSNHVVCKYLYLVYQLLPLPTAMILFTVPSNGFRYLRLLEAKVPCSLFLPLSPTELAFSLGFQDYFVMKTLYKYKEDENFSHLRYLATEVNFRILFSRYALKNLHHKLEKPQTEEEESSERLFQSLDLLAFFLKEQSLPEEDIALLSRCLALDFSVFWSEQERIQYVPLFQILGRYYPDVLEKMPTYWDAFHEKLSLLSQNLEAAKEQEGTQVSLVQQFFHNPTQLLEAIYDDQFVESNFFQTFLKETSSSVFLANLLHLCLEQEDVETMETLVELLQVSLWKLQEKKQHDQTGEEELSFQNPLYFRYYLSSTFPMLRAWLMKYFPMEDTWVQRHFANGNLPTLEWKVFSMKSSFYATRTPYLWSYNLGGDEPVITELISYPQLQGKEITEEEYWGLLPISFCLMSEKEKVVEDIRRRLNQLHPSLTWYLLPEKLFSVIARPIKSSIQHYLTRENHRYQFGACIDGIMYYWRLDMIRWGSTAEDKRFTEEGPLSSVTLERLEKGESLVLSSFTIPIRTDALLDFMSIVMNDLNRLPWEEFPEPVKIRVKTSQEDTERELADFTFLEEEIWREDVSFVKIEWEKNTLIFRFEAKYCVCLLYKEEQFFILTPQNGWQEFKITKDFDIEAFFDLGRKTMMHHRFFLLCQLKRIILFSCDEKVSGMDQWGIGELYDNRD